MIKNFIDLSKDFKKFLSETKDFPDWDIFQSVYWQPNSKFLDVWFGTEYEFWKKHVMELDLAYYKILIKNLDIEKYFERVRNIWQKCEEILDVNIDADLCFLIGLGPTGKADKVDDRQVVFLPLDLPLNSNYEIIIAHEVFHIANEILLNKRNDVNISLSKPTLLDIIINEGMATAFSLIICSGKTIFDALFWLKEDDIKWMEINEKRLIQEMSKIWENEATYNLLQRYVWDLPGRKEDIPPQTAYYIGCKLCQKALEYTNIRHLASLTSNEIIDLIKNEIL